MSMRKTPQEIREGIESGFGNDEWDDLIADFNLRADQDENLRLTVQCTHFLEQQFPGEKFGWQDFDIVLARKLQGRYKSRVDYGRRVIDADVRLGKTTYVKAVEMTDAEIADYPLTKEGFHVMDATDDTGGVIAFIGIRTLADVLRG